MISRKIEKLIEPATGKFKSEQDRQVRQNQHEIHEMEEPDILSHAHELAIATKAMYGVMVQILQRIEEQTSLARGQVLQVYQNVATQNTFYPTTKAIVDGVVNGFIVGGTGNVTVKKISQSISPSGSLTLFTLPLNGNTLYVPFRISAQNQDYFTVATDVAASGVVTLSFTVVPVSKTGKEMAYFATGEAQ